MTQVTFTQFIDAVKAGELVSFPTDTVPALASRPDHASLIFQAKQRSTQKPLILMGAAWTDLLPYIQGTPEEMKVWKAIADQYWPGALTLVLPASSLVPQAMIPHDRTTIGLRIPDLPLACEILAETQPLATTSVNRSGEPPLETFSAIEMAFPDLITFSPPNVPLNAKIGSGLPSTVAKWTGEGWTILRQGSVVLSV